MCIANIKTLIMSLSPEDKASLREFLDRDQEQSKFFSTAGVGFDCASGDESTLNLTFEFLGNNRGHVIFTSYCGCSGEEAATQHELEALKRMVALLSLAVEKLEAKD